MRSEPRTDTKPRLRKTRQISPMFLSIPLVFSATSSLLAAGEFSREVAPLLARGCLSCHSGAEPKGELDLATRAGAEKGGQSGKVITPGKPEDSLLWQYVRDGDMPPKKPLSPAEQETVRAWIAGGARWDMEAIDPFRFTSGDRAGYDWWALQPIERPTLPEVGNRDGIANPIDLFVRARLESQGLSNAPQANRRTLIRRLYFGLLGLPPTPEAVEAFTQDPRPDAHERLVDRLLASPHYGERWARHWLDVVRFGESQGFERDKLREHAWPYRDWVVEAFNRDMPYDRFARCQLAGDVLPPENPDALVATGFLVAGPYDEVGQNQQSEVMRAVVRQDELEDIISAVGQTFLGLTVHCARCHDHKFDPIRQREYYRLAAALAGVRHGEREISLPPEREAELRARLKAVRAEIAAIEEPVRSAILEQRQPDGRAKRKPPKPVARWEFDGDLRDSIGRLHGKSQREAAVKRGRLHVADGSYVKTAPLETDVRAKTLEVWVRLGSLEQRGGGVISLQTLDGEVFDAIVFGEQEPRRWMAGSDHFHRTESFHGPEETEAGKQFVHVAIVYREDGTIAGYWNGKPYGEPYKSDAPVTFKAGRAQLLFGLRHEPAGGNRLLSGMIERASLYDRALSAAEVAASAGAPHVVDQRELRERMSVQTRRRHAQLKTELASLLEQLKDRTVYAVAPRQPKTTHLLLRGNPAQKDKVVKPGGIRALAGVDAEFELGPNSPESERRRKLAEWISADGNPLFARVIVNRLWHYHFGAGFVATPSDFGFNGARPTHPELLDWLAAELIARDWSLKAIQRLMVTSATYRQSSRFDEHAAAVDAGNRLLWRGPQRRLEAEVLRDSMLAVAGQLNRQMGGPGYRDFETFVRNTQFYIPVDVDDWEHSRRTIYRTWVRSGRNRLLDAFDCPDPSTKTPRRTVTTTPLQALSLMNHSFVLRMADRLAERVASEAGPEPADLIHRLLLLTYGRRADPQELAEMQPFVEKHGLPALCRVIFNTNEFLYVD